jgi:adenosylhomocysteine nucleosidase
MSQEACSSKPASILVCFAVENEAKPFRPHVRRIEGVHILVTGMGHKNARRSISERLKFTRPELVISSGFAGSLAPNLRCRDIVFEEPLSPALRTVLEQTRAHAATFHCASRIAVTQQEKRLLREQTGSDVVEMESGIIAEVCRKEGIPVAVIRVILDEAEEDLPLDFSRMLDENERLLFGKLFMALIRSPGKIPDLIRFGNRSKKAAIALADTLSRMLTAIQRGT